jgi:hypothetical protein
MAAGQRRIVGLPQLYEFNKEVENVNVLCAAISCILALAFSVVRVSRAAEIYLPPVGTNISYDYATGSPALNIFANTPTGEVLQSELTFAGGQQLFVQFENIPPTPRGMQVDLQLRGAGLRELFEPLRISFDEQLSLITDNGAIIYESKNTGIGYSDDDPNYYSFSWTVEPLEHDFFIRGLQWNISPDLVSGAVLPTTIDAQLSLFANGAIWVVPEPATAALALIVAAVPATFRGRSAEL